MEKVEQIEKILNYSIREENKVFIDKLIKDYNPIDIILRVVEEDVKIEIGDWTQNRMLDTIYALLSSQNLLQEVKNNVKAIQESYSMSHIISKDAYDKSKLSKDLDSTHLILFTIVFYYRS